MDSANTYSLFISALFKNILLIEKYAGKAIEKKAAGSAETFD